MEGKTNSRENNFNIIRFMAAIMVMAGHMAYIGGYSLPILWGQGIQSLGVKIFFLIGGYLIKKVGYLILIHYVIVLKEYLEFFLLWLYILLLLHMW